MTSTTVPPTTRSAADTARLATIGAALWMLLPVAGGVASLEEQDFGSLSFLAVAASKWIFFVLPPALLVVGHTALRTALGSAAGRVALTGIVLASLGLGAMTLGNGIEVASMTVGGGEVGIGHAIFLIGFLASVVGGVLVGSTVIRRRRDALSRIAGWVLVLALPLGIGIGALGLMIVPENDAGFWAAISVPVGLAWLLLGRSLTLEHRNTALTAR